MKTKKTYFMHEDYVEDIRPVSHVSIDEKKISFLKSFINEIGIISSKESPSVKVPIQSVLREKIKNGFDFSDVVPKQESSFYESKALPELPNKTLPTLENKRPRRTVDLVPQKEIEEKIEKKPSGRVYSKEGVLYYKPGKTSFKKYGIIDPLIADKEVTRIRCVDLIIRVDYREHKNLHTGLSFKKANDINKLLKKIAKEAGYDVSEEESLLDFDMPEGFSLHGNYGTDFIDPNFVLERI